MTLVDLINQQWADAYLQNPHQHHHHHHHHQSRSNSHRSHFEGANTEFDCEIDFDPRLNGQEYSNANNQDTHYHHHHYHHDASGARHKLKHQRTSPNSIGPNSAKRPSASAVQYDLLSSKKKRRLYEGESESTNSDDNSTHNDDDDDETDGDDDYVPLPIVKTVRRSPTSHQTKERRISVSAARKLSTGSSSTPKKRSEKKSGNCGCCGTDDTPLWREGAKGVRLCNACGIRWVKYSIACDECKYVPRKHESKKADCPRCQTPFAAAKPLSTRRKHAAVTASASSSNTSSPLTLEPPKQLCLPPPPTKKSPPPTKPNKNSPVIVIPSTATLSTVNVPRLQ